jgi:ribonuclease BN (tRNA processing enzyme)
MSGGIFGDIDVSSANENPFFKPDGKYLSKVTAATVRYSNAGNKGMPIEYTIQEGEKQGKKINEWKPVPEPWQILGYATEEDAKEEVNKSAKIKEDAARDLAFIKQRLKQFGFSNEEMNTVQPEDFLELPLLLVEIKNHNGQERIWGVEIYDPEKSDNPFG